MKNKKGQTTGLVIGLVFGIASLVIGVIIALVITSTLGDANLIGNDDSYSTDIINESVTFTALNADQTLTAASYATATSSISCGTITWIANQTTEGEYITNGNVTQTSCVVLNATALSDVIGKGTVYISYPYTTSVHKSQNSVGNMTSNFTAGIDNVSSKLPTVLLIAAIVLILSVLAILVGVWQRMKLGSGSL